MSDDKVRAHGIPDGHDGAPDVDPDAAARAALGRARSAAAAKGWAPGKSARPQRNRTAGRGVGAGGAPSEPYQAGRDPRHIGSDVDHLVSALGWSTPLAVAGVVGRWREVVGHEVADHCRPETFEEGALVVRADSTAWAMQVRLLLPQLERRLAEEVGEGVVESITVLGPAGPRWTRGPWSVPGRGPRDTYG